MGQIGVGGNKRALRDHSEVPGVMGVELSLGSSARENVGERDMGHLDVPPVSHRGCDHT